MQWVFQSSWGTVNPATQQWLTQEDVMSETNLKPFPDGYIHLTKWLITENNKESF